MSVHEYSSIRIKNNKNFSIFIITKILWKKNIFALYLVFTFIFLVEKNCQHDSEKEKLCIDRRVL